MDSALDRLSRMDIRHVRGASLRLQHDEAMPDLLPGMDRLDASERAGRLAYFNNIAFGAFLLGGAAGGVAFGILGDRVGRVKALMLTIATYSAFTFVSAFSTEWWHLVGFRFLVAMGVGGEWAVAASLGCGSVPEESPCMVAGDLPRLQRLRDLACRRGRGVHRCRPGIRDVLHRLGICRELAGRFCRGALPALLILVIRWKLRGETEAWSKSRLANRKRAGRALELFRSDLRRKTLVGISLAAIGLSTFWGVHIYGKDLLRAQAEKRIDVAALSDGTSVASADDRFARLKRWEMLGMLLASTGGAAGLLAFGAFAEWVGRRRAFALYHLAGLGAALALFQWFSTPTALLVALPIFGFFTLGMHAGYAVYFPELFPTRVRSTGAGLCFNVARILAAPVLFISGWLQRDGGMTLRGSASLLSLLFLAGAAVIAAGPETKDADLPE